MRSFLFIIMIGAAAFAGWLALHLIPASGVFAKLEPILVDQCRRIEIAPGTEDIEIDEATGQVFISAFDRRGWYAGNDHGFPRGGIYMIDLADPEMAPTLVSEDAPQDFSPHGISLWRGDNGSRRLFVVNHRRSGKEAVEMFDIDEAGRLAHADIVSFKEMYSPNDVVAVGAREFYASNDQKYDHGWKRTAETYLALPLTDIVYFDGAKGSIAAKGLVYANGVNVSADGKELYVAEVLKRRVDIFARDAATGKLTLKKRIRLNTAPDNIDVAPDGSLYIAGHSKIFDFVKHAQDKNAIAPSHVVRVDLRSMRREDVFIATEGEINASSVGAAGKGWLFVGAVFDGHVMACPIGA